MISDSELVERLHAVLRDADLTTTTSASVRRKLEEHFGVSFSDRKAFIRENIDLYLQSIQQNEDEEEERADEDVGEEENAESQEEERGDEDVDDDDEEDEDGAAGSSNDRCSRKRGLPKPDKGAKKRGGGFTKLCSLSPQLQNFIGEAELARTQVVKQIWAYIRENNLQDPSNRRKIICDEKLQELFNVKSIDMFQMNKVLTNHIWPLGSTKGPPRSAEKDIPKSKEKDKAKSNVKETHIRKISDNDEEDEPHRKDKRQKTCSSGLLAPLRLSNALAKFIGTGESEMSRADVVKRIWDYIKQENLQDPSDKRRIICDDKLKELFEVETFTGFTVAKLLAAHFTKIEN